MVQHVVDAYGFIVQPAYVHLHMKFKSIWQLEESERKERWHRWLDTLRSVHRKQQQSSSSTNTDTACDGLTDTYLLKQAIQQHRGNGSGGLCSPAMLRQLRALVQMGIPADDRAEFYPILLDIESKCKHGEFHRLVSLAAQQEQLSSSSSSRVGETPHYMENDWIDQIDKDLHRTFPGNTRLDTAGMAALRRVLAAYSCYNPSVGYCQGINYLSALLLLLMPRNEENVFWCLCAIVDVLDGYFDMEMRGAQIDLEVFAQLLRSNVPRVAAHLEESLHVHAPSATAAWFLLAYVTLLPCEAALRVWDLMLFERSPAVLFRVGLALIDIYSKALLETTDSTDAYMLLQSLCPMSFDTSRLLDTSCISYAHVRECTLHSLRQEAAKKLASAQCSTTTPFDSSNVESSSGDVSSYIPAAPPASPRMLDGLTRRSQSAGALGSLATQLLQQQYHDRPHLFDLQSLTIFQPNLQQPSVETAFKIALNPENSPDTSPILSATEAKLALTWATTSATQTQLMQRQIFPYNTAQVLRYKNAGTQHPGDGGTTVDVGALAETLPLLEHKTKGSSSNPSSTAAAGYRVPRRHTDGGILLKQSLPTNTMSTNTTRIFGGCATATTAASPSAAHDVGSATHSPHRKPTLQRFDVVSIVSRRITAASTDTAAPLQSAPAAAVGHTDDDTVSELSMNAKQYKAIQLRDRVAALAAEVSRHAEAARTKLRGMKIDCCRLNARASRISK